MTEPLCDSCGEWTDPATLQDGDCPGCVAVRPDTMKPDEALQAIEWQWLRQGSIYDVEGDDNEGPPQGWIDAEPPATPEYLRERGFAEPE